LPDSTDSLYLSMFVVGEDLFVAVWGFP